MSGTSTEDIPLSIGNGIFGESPLSDGGEDLFGAASPAPTVAPAGDGQWQAPTSAQEPASLPSLPGMLPMQDAFTASAGPVPGPYAFKPAGLGDDSSSTNVGRALLLVGLGATLGYTQLGVKGLLIGSLWGGAASNAWSAATSTPQERLVAGTWAVIEGAAAGWLTWSALKKEHV